LEADMPVAHNADVEFRTLLSQVRYFSKISPESQAAIQASAAPRQFKAGQIIYLEGEPAESVYILESGWVKATRMTADGREQAMQFLKPVEVFGDISVFTDRPYPGSVAALEPVKVWKIPAKVLLELVERHPDLAMAVIRHLGERVLHFINLVEDLSLRSVEARLAHTLLQHAEIIDGKYIIPRREWTTFDEMAVRLGTVRDVLSRALHTLEKEGLLKVERQEIVLLNPKGLALRGDR
jgi:CRP-like cAMP-binding protein